LATAVSSPPSAQRPAAKGQQAGGGEEGDSSR
jgi:hypothetical protein